MATISKEAAGSQLAQCRNFGEAAKRDRTFGCHSAFGRYNGGYTGKS